MKPEIKAKWLEELRGGEYKQSRRTLRNSEGYCCMGVLVDIYIKETGKGSWNSDYLGNYVFEGDSMSEEAVLPQEVMEWAGLHYPNPNIVDNNPCGKCNDVLELTFDQIADAIEKTL